MIDDVEFMDRVTSKQEIRRLRQRVKELELKVRELESGPQLPQSAVNDSKEVYESLDRDLTAVAQSYYEKR